MPQCTAAIEDFPMALALVKAMQAHGSGVGQGLSPSRSQDAGWSTRSRGPTGASIPAHLRRLGARVHDTQGDEVLVALSGGVSGGYVTIGLN